MTGTPNPRRSTEPGLAGSGRGVLLRVVKIALIVVAVLFLVTRVIRYVMQ